MSKKIHLGTSFIMVGGVVSASSLHSWGLGWDYASILGVSFAIVVWLSLVLVVKKIFGN